MQIIVINGMPTAGKDLFVSYCKKHLLWCGNFSTVDFVKEIATLAGWDGTKTPKNRDFLSALKDLLTDWDDVPFKKIERAIESFNAEALSYDFSTNDVLCFVHCREPWEIKKFAERLGAKTLLIRRPDVEGANQTNHADAEVFGYVYDYTIYNDGTKEELEAKAIEFLKELGYTHFRPQK